MPASTSSSASRSAAPATPAPSRSAPRTCQEKLTGDRTFTITVRGHDEGLVSKHLARNADVGTVVHLSQAEGDFVLPSLLPRKLLMISGGSGITPLMSMLRSLVDFRYEGRITFVHYARSPEETIFAAELDELAQHTNLDLTVVHTRTGGKRLSELQLRGLLPAYLDTATFACGPAGMIETLKGLYGDSELLRVEYFKTSTIDIDPDDATGKLSFARSGSAAENDGKPILEQAEAAGLTPAYGCRMGICFTCTARKSEGTVRNVVTGAESHCPTKTSRSVSTSRSATASSSSDRRDTNMTDTLTTTETITGPTVEPTPDTPDTAPRRRRRAAASPPSSSRRSARRWTRSASS